MPQLNEISAPPDLTYLASFLTFRCRFKCSYCINHFKSLARRKELTASDWIEGLNRLVIPREMMVPITLQGGEPSSHREFYKIIRGLKKEFYIDLLTNLDFNIDEFMDQIPPDRLKRDVPYASIRVSYHPEFSELDTLLKKIEKMLSRGYSIGLFAVDTPANNIPEVRQKAVEHGIDFRTKEFLGFKDNRLYGEYLYPEAVSGLAFREVMCKNTEILIAPDGYIHKCHRDLYHGEYPVANLLDENLNIAFKDRSCGRFGECNPCDIKVKNNRFQEFGHCSVQIKSLETQLI